MKNTLIISEKSEQELPEIVDTVLFTQLAYHSIRGHQEDILTMLDVVAFQLPINTGNPFTRKSDSEPIITVGDFVDLDNPLHAMYARMALRECAMYN